MGLGRGLFGLGLERREVRLGLGRGPVWKSTTEFGAPKCLELVRVVADLARVMDRGAFSWSALDARRGNTVETHNVARGEAALKL